MSVQNKVLYNIKIENMDCSVDLPPLSSCDKDQQITKFGRLRGFVSDVYYENNILSFSFGSHKQIITLFNFKGDQWLKDGMYIEVDFDQRSITHDPRIYPNPE